MQRRSHRRLRQSDPLLLSVLSALAESSLREVDICARAGYSAESITRLRLAKAQPGLQKINHLLNVVGYELKVVKK